MHLSISLSGALQGFDPAFQARTVEVVSLS
jgi:hypothetical protein